MMGSLAAVARWNVSVRWKRFVLRTAALVQGCVLQAGTEQIVKQVADNVLSCA